MWQRVLTLRGCAQLIVLSCGAVSSPANSQETDAAWRSAFPANPLYESADGGISLWSRGRVLLDLGATSDADNSFDRETGEVRVLVGGLIARVGPKFDARFFVNFANGEMDIKDAGIRYQFTLGGSGDGDIFVGQTKMPNTLQGPTSIIHNTMMERAAVNRTFTILRMTGVTIRYAGDHWGVTAGAYKDSIGTATVNEDLAYAARSWMGGESERGTWLLGGSARYRKANTAGDGIRYRERAYSHLAEDLIDTGNIGRKDWFYGLEAAYFSGRFHAAAEFARVDADLISGDEASFQGGYLEAGLFLTDHTRSIRWDKGIWFETDVPNPVIGRNGGGLGAWQLAARFDTVDLTGGPVAGGEQDNWAIGVNWFLNTHARVMVNYTHSEIRRAFDVPENGVDGRNSADSVGMRLQLDW